MARAVLTQAGLRRTVAVQASGLPCKPDGHVMPDRRRAPDADPRMRRIDHFAAAIRGPAAALVDAADAGRSVALVDAIPRATRTGQRETFA